MGKYIDADRLRTEIDKQEIGYNIDGKHAAEYDTCVKILRIIDSLQQEQPSLPDNLDEAAKEYMKKARKHLFDDSPIGRADDAFKAGAEWMAGQGYTVDGIVFCNKE